MLNFFGYLSSYFVTFGLFVGFAFGAVIFAVFITYAIMLIFKRTRRIIEEEQPQSFLPIQKRVFTT